MQTFITDIDPAISASNLDNKRLGKQRVEAIQIARTLLGLSDGWKNHPIMRLWKGYESWLIRVYLHSILKEWEHRGFNNDKCTSHYKILASMVPLEIKYPHWIDEQFIESHRSNLIRKNKEYYQAKFPSVPDDISYIWPSGD